jgi:hypothetical protein
MATAKKGKVLVGSTRATVDFSFFLLVFFKGGGGEMNLFAHVIGVSSLFY